jgi:site-specific DNA recombinase
MTKKAAEEKQRRISVLYPSASIDEEAAKDKEKLRVAAYCRVSTDFEEQQASFMAQKAYYEKTLAENEDYLFIGIYADEGVTGTNVRKRDGFLRMMADSRAGKLDLIVTKSVSRFGRNTVDCLNAIRELKALGIDVFFEKENIHTMHSEGELLLTLMMAVAEAESVSISENVKWGMRKRVSQGRSLLIGTPPFGYDKDGDGLTINECEAQIIRRIFREVLDGYSCTDVARRLTQDKIPTRNGAKRWTERVVHQIVDNEKYKGDCCYQKSYVADPITKKKKSNRGELPRYYIEATHEPIIDPSMWECAQLELKRRSAFYAEYLTAPTTAAEAAPFQAKVICAECGCAYVKASHSKYLRCASHERLRGKKGYDGLPCLKTRIVQADAEQAFVKAWNALVNGCDEYAREWREIAEYGDMLQSYRAKELLRLVKETGYIGTMPTGLCLKVLGHIEVNTDGSLEVVFLAGTRVNRRSMACAERLS